MTCWIGGMTVASVLGICACNGVPATAVGADIVEDSYPEARGAIEAARAACAEAAMRRDWDTLRAFHLDSPKFSKITSKGVRQDFDEMIADEIAGVSAMLDAVPDLEADLRDQKIDVFGDTAVETAFLVVTGTLPNGDRMEMEFGVSAVWVLTDAGWKIAHEHATPNDDIVEAAFPMDQAAVRTALSSLAEIGRERDWEALRSAHLESPKFSEIAEGIQRNDFDAMLAREVAGISSLEGFSIDWRDLKIDVFGDVAVATAFPVYTGTMEDGERIELERRATMVFVRTPDGWKIAHEHLSVAEAE